MAIQHNPGVEWRRMHDYDQGPALVPHVADAQAVESVGDVVDACVNRNGMRLKACGSHWGLSTAAVSDGIFIETNWPKGGDHPRLSGLAGDLDEISSLELVQYLADNPPATEAVLQTDPCLHYGFGPYFVHLYAGTRIYDAYVLLDRVAGADGGPFLQDVRSRLGLRRDPAAVRAYDGPWGFATLGGAGGQTVFGALTTGTHGGDYRQGPISDQVVALHLVTDEGRQFWIEPGPGRYPCAITHDDKLKQKYGALVPPGKSFEIVRDDKIFDAVVVGAGRFGVVTSIVLAVMPQYSLLQHRDLANWSDVKKMLMGPQKHHSFDLPYFAPKDQAQQIAKFEQRFSASVPNIQNRFLQIAVNVCPHGKDDHRCGVTQRWWVPQSSPEATVGGAVAGRAERGTPAMAGNSYPYDPPDPGEKSKTGGTFLEKACSSGDFIAGVLRATAAEIEEIIHDGFVPAASGVAAALAIGAGGTVVALAAGLCAALAAAVVILKALADAIDAAGNTSLASNAYAATHELLTSPEIPQPLALMIVRCVMLAMFEFQQGYQDYVAISYAMMDGHDYHDRSCFSNADSIEVFFDASDPDVYCAFLDQVLAFEGAQQVDRGQVTIGYVSLRFIKGGLALLSPARFPETVVMEIAEIRLPDGSTPFVDNAVAIARHPFYAAPFHWGQRNPLDRYEVNRSYNGAPKAGALDKWRHALQFILRECAAKDAFSSAFTRQTGLEP